jgi:hypothetical protein
MSTTTAPTFRRIMRGLYGTGIHTRPIGSIGYDQPESVEIVIDHMNNAWWIREMTADGDLTDTCGEAFYTLADAKDYVTRRAGWWT